MTRTDGADAAGATDRGDGEVADSAGVDGAAPRRVQPVRRGRFSERMRAESPYPPFRTTLRRAFLAVATSPAILIVPLLFVVALWWALVGLGLRVFPVTLVSGAGIPPVSTVFTDLALPSTVYGLTASAFLTSVAITFVRALVWSAIVGMMLEALEFGSVSAVGLLQGLRASPSVLSVFGLELAAIVGTNFILPLILGPIGELASVVVLFGAVYLLPMAFAAAVRGPLRGPDAIRGSFRAARLPGPRALVLSISYFFLALVLMFFEPQRNFVTANASIAQWAWVLGGTVVHTVFLAAFCERWLAVEGQVSTAPAPRRPRQPRPVRSSR